MTEFWMCTKGVNPIPYQNEGGNLIIAQFIESIPEQAFEGDDSICSVGFSDRLLNIGHRAFSLCSNLREIRFPDNLESIGDFAFSSCRIKKLTIPKSVLHIGECAFAHCEALSELHILGNPSIGPNAFANCFSLKVVRFESPCNYTSSNIFDKTPNTIIENKPITFHTPIGTFIRTYD